MSQGPEEDIGDIPTLEKVAADPLKKGYARTSSLLAYILVLGLIGFLLVYFVTLLFITQEHPDRTETIQDFFNTVLPVLTGLAGSAVAYFLSKENRPD